MTLNFRFAIASDLHIALPHTIPTHTFRFHRTELSIPIFEKILDHLSQLDLDFFLIPGDLTQDGEPDNHEWLSKRLAELPFPTYVIPGNHDFIERDGGDRSIAASMFPEYYMKFGYQGYFDQSSAKTQSQLYYITQPIPGVSLIGLNSIFFDEEGKQLNTGRLDNEQLRWLAFKLQSCSDDLVLVMVHHNVVEHLPGQASSSLGKRYMLENAPELITILQQFGVQLVFTGHLHVQDVASIKYMSNGSEDLYGDTPSALLQHQSIQGKRLYDITTGSSVTYPHPFRVLNYSQNSEGYRFLRYETNHIDSLPDWDDLQTHSREFMAERSQRFMFRLLTDPPLNLPEQKALELSPHLYYFWPDIAAGDAQFDFPGLPPQANQYFSRFSSANSIDNQAKLIL